MKYACRNIVGFGSALDFMLYFMLRNTFRKGNKMNTTAPTKDDTILSVRRDILVALRC